MMKIERSYAWIDKFLALGLGCGVVLLSWFSGNNLEFPPELWQSLAEASSVRPPIKEFPILWQALLAHGIDAFGVNACVSALKCAGPFALGVLAVISCDIFFSCLPKTLRRQRGKGRLVTWAVVFQAVLLFICSEPVWLAGRVFSPELMLLLLTALCVVFVLRAIEKSSVFCMVFSGALSGVLAAETPLAVLLPVWCGYRLYAKYRIPILEEELPPMANPIVYVSSLRRMILAFLLCWVGVFAFNLAFFRMQGGGGSEAGVFIATLKYLVNYFKAPVAMATPMCWLLVIVLVLSPLAIVLSKLRDLADPQKFLPVTALMFLSAGGVLAALQLLAFPECHFWKWGLGTVTSGYALCLCMLGLTVTVTCIICIFAVDVFFRNYARLMREFCPEALEDEPMAWKVVKQLKLSTKLLRVPMCAEPFLALALILPFRFDSTAREVASIVNGIADQTARECGEAQVLFTDGAYDAAVEMAAVLQGKKLKTLSMMSTLHSYDTALRLRGEEEGHDCELLKAGASHALRFWVLEDIPRASNIAVQVGFELWRHAKKPMPKVGGLVARTGGFETGEAARWAEAAQGLAQRVLKVYESAGASRRVYPALWDMFVFGQWRLSWMCRMRANEADAARDFARFEQENGLADKLDMLNPQWQKVQEQMSWIGKNGGIRLTPREGLKLGLERADFKMARVHAQKILALDPNDMQANFALGMGYFTEKVYSKAELHLKRCLLKAPKEAAVLNNLAIVQLHLGKLGEAEINAQKALESFPGSSEIKTTLRHIKAAIAERAAEKEK